jgi:hypothetical protein
LFGSSVVCHESCHFLRAQMLVCGDKGRVDGKARSSRFESTWRGKA